MEGEASNPMWSYADMPPQQGDPHGEVELPNLGAKVFDGGIEVGSNEVEAPSHGDGVQIDLTSSDEKIRTHAGDPEREKRTPNDESEAANREAEVPNHEARLRNDKEARNRHVAVPNHAVARPNHQGRVLAPAVQDVIACMKMLHAAIEKYSDYFDTHKESQKPLSAWPDYKQTRTLKAAMEQLEKRTKLLNGMFQTRTSAVFPADFVCKEGFELEKLRNDITETIEPILVWFDAYLNVETLRNEAPDEKIASDKLAVQGVKMFCERVGNSVITAYALFQLVFARSCAADQATDQNPPSVEVKESPSDVPTVTIDADTFNTVMKRSKTATETEQQGLKSIESEKRPAKEKRNSRFRLPPSGSWLRCLGAVWLIGLSLVSLDLINSQVKLEHKIRAQYGDLQGKTPPSHKLLANLTNPLHARIDDIWMVLDSSQISGHHNVSDILRSSTRSPHVANLKDEVAKLKEDVKRIDDGIGKRFQNLKLAMEKEKNCWARNKRPCSTFGP